MIRHLDLFSGIGGFALAIDEVFGESEHIFCEIDGFCQAILRKRFEGSIIYGDIRQLNSNTHWSRLQVKGAELKTSGDRQLSEAASDPEGGESGLTKAGDRREDTCGGSKKRIDILTGGFPCQPFSAAGKRRGTSDNRYLWPEMFRVIKDFKPTWVVAENVRGLLNIEGGMVFEQVLSDLEAANYEVQAFVIPACAVNAPHRRDRVWIVAHAGCEHGERSTFGREPEREVLGEEDASLSKRPDSDARKEPIGDTASVRRNDGKRNRQRGHIQNTTIRKNEKNKQERDRRLAGVSKRDSNAPDTESARLKSRLNRQRQKQFWGSGAGQNWFEIATELCGVDDGLPAELDGFKLTKAGHRVGRLKALGNAIVPQVAIEIFKGIKSTYER